MAREREAAITYVGLTSPPATSPDLIYHPKERLLGSYLLFLPVLFYMSYLNRMIQLLTVPLMLGD